MADLLVQSLLLQQFMPQRFPYFRILEGQRGKIGILLQHFQLVLRQRSDFIMPGDRHGPGDLLFLPQGENRDSAQIVPPGAPQSVRQALIIFPVLQISCRQHGWQQAGFSGHFAPQHLLLSSLNVTDEGTIVFHKDNKSFGRIDQLPRTGQQPLHLGVKSRLGVGNQTKHRPVLFFPQQQFAFRRLASVYFRRHPMVGLLQLLANLQHFFIHGGQFFIGSR